MERLTRLTELVKGTGCYRYGVDGKYVSSFSIGYEDSPSVLRGEVVDRLAAYEDAEEQGRLVILPCKLGDTVWVLHTGFNTNFLHVYEGRCVEISQSLSCGAMLESYTINLLAFNVVFYGQDIGSTMFFSRSEAEAALKKRKGG